MSKELNFICCVHDDVRFRWEIRVYLDSLVEHGYDHIAQILIFLPNDNLSVGFHKDWKNIELEYPKTSFHYYTDTDDIQRIGKIFGYIPVFRPYILHKHFLKYPELKNKAIFYTDSDIVFLKTLDFSKFLNDDVNYLSWTGDKERTSNYIWSDYIDSKYEEKDNIPVFVRKEKWNDFKKIDVLNEMGEIAGINREIIVKNRENTGGAQYLLKNIDAQFWEKVLNTCITIKHYLANINQEYMIGNTPTEKEHKGFQSFCADMWALLYTLWASSALVECPKELDFSWSTDKINSDNSILHNAGVTSDATIRTRIKDENKEAIYVDCPAFYKAAYITSFPTKEKLEKVINNPVSSEFFTAEYAKKVLKILK